jgi:protoporphyrinogen oxidase
MYAARRTGLKKEMFGYAPGGYVRVLRRMTDVLAAEGVEVHTSAAADRIVAQSDGTVVVDAASEQHEFDRVVVTCPSQIVPRILPQLGDGERRRHEGVEYLGIVCASVLLDRKLADFYVTNITDAGAPFTAVIEMTALVDPRELGDRTLAYLPRYAAADDEAWNWSDAEVEERFLTALERMYPAFRRAHVQAFRVSRVRHVFALPTLGYSERLPAIATGVPHVFAVNSAHIVGGTLNVNEVVELANEACDAVLMNSIKQEDNHGGTEHGQVDSYNEDIVSIPNSSLREPRVSVVETH